MGFDFSVLDYDTPTAWIKYPDGGEVLLAYMSTPELVESFQKLLGRRRRTGSLSLQLEEDKIPTEDLCKWLAKNVLLDWKDIYYKGQPFPPTEENRYQLLFKYPGFRAWVIQQANTIWNFKSEVEDLKNSGNGENVL
jgi:hypothetical protein